MFTYPYHFALKIKSLIYNSFVLVSFFFSSFPPPPPPPLVKIIKQVYLNNLD